MDILNDLFLRYLAKNDGRMLVDYCKDVGRVKEVEVALLRANNILDISQYAEEVVKGRWEEAETILAGVASYAIEYARKCCVGRFPLFEKHMIDRNLKELMVDYCRRGCLCRVRELEPYIARGTLENILGYVLNVTYGRFELAEPKIIKKPGWILRYRDVLGHVGKGDEFPVEMHSAMVLYSSSKPSDKNIKDYFSKYAK